MSGPENLKGFDYQISYSLLKCLEYIRDNVFIDCVQFESLDENEEDFNIISDKKEFHQIKKRMEGNHWTPSDLKDIFENFINKNDNDTFFYFITDGTANPDVKKLKEYLDSKEEIKDEFLEQFLPLEKTLDQLKNVLQKTVIDIENKNISIYNLIGLSLEDTKFNTTEC